MQCLTIAIENPPAKGEYRVFNQFEETYTVLELAEIVKREGESLGLKIDINLYENPRTEAAEHYYQPDRQKLLDLGYVPSHDVAAEVRLMLRDLMPHADRIREKADILVPDIRWDGHHHRSQVIEKV
jgi:UDP-sulfoquinovose synthase